MTLIRKVKDTKTKFAPRRKVLKLHEGRIRHDFNLCVKDFEVGCCSMVHWLSPMPSIFKQSLKSGFKQLQVMFTACQRFEEVIKDTRRKFKSRSKLWKLHKSSSIYFSKVWKKVLHRCQSSFWHMGGWGWWELPVVAPTGYEA